MVCIPVHIYAVTRRALWIAEAKKVNSEAKQPMTNLRQYENAPERVREHYAAMRANQTTEYNTRMRTRPLDQRMTVSAALELLADCPDASDPDVEGSNLMHAYQTAERMRAAGESEWMQLAGLIHDLGKIQMLRGCDADGQSRASQWGISGDTWAVGCALPDCIVYPELNELSPERDHPVYGTEQGRFIAGCGIRSLMFAWGHDEYMYRVLDTKRSEMLEGGATVVLPREALDCVRLHSAYPWHTGGAYGWAEAPGDDALKALVRRFNQYDLYSKEDKECDIEELKPYYQGLIDKFLPGELAF